MDSFCFVPDEVFVKLVCVAAVRLVSLFLHGFGACRCAEVCGYVCLVDDGIEYGCFSLVLFVGSCVEAA